MAGINLDADLGVRGFLKGTKDMEGALQDVSDELENTAKDGDNALEKLSDKLIDAKKAADAAKESGSKIGDGVKKGAAEAETATETYKKEAIANISEVTSSFNGSWESAADAVQGTLGGVVQDLNGFAAVAAVAGALGAGVIAESIRKAEEAARLANERVVELGKAMIEAGDSSKKPLGSVVDDLSEIITNSENSVKKFKDIRKQAELLGLDAGLLATAYAGGEEALKDQAKAFSDLLEEAEKVRDEEKERYGIATEASALRVEDLQAEQEKLKKVTDEIALAAEAEQNWLKTGGAEMLAKADAIDNINQSYDEAVGSVLDFIGEESGVLDVQAYIDAMQAREDALNNYQTALAESGLSTEQKAALNEMGVDAAAAWLEGYKSATPEQRNSMKRFLTESAKDSSGEAKKVLDEAFKKPIVAKVETLVDTLSAQKSLEDLIRARTAIIKVDFQDRYGKRAY